MRGLLLFVWLVWSLAYAFPRVGVHEGFTRLVFDLPAKGVEHTLSQEEGRLILVLRGVRAQAQDQVVNSPEVASVQTVPEEGRVRVLVHLKGPVEVTVRRLPDPERLVVDLALKKEA
ncbi:AMIN domain-containing protein, partial [Shewanella sp. C31]|nr:AMIN domain-containing protein [Shewanella electrica]